MNLFKETRKYRCPACGEKLGVNIQYGMLGIDMAEAAERGEVVLGGCCIDDDSPERQCIGCGHKWKIKRRKPVEMMPHRGILT